MGNGRHSGLSRSVTNKSNSKYNRTLNLNIPKNIYRSRDKRVIDGGLELVQNLLKGLGLNYKSLPEYNMELTRKSDTYAAVSIFGNNFFVGLAGRDYEKWMKNYNYDVKSGWHPEDTTGDAIFAHEYGHIIEKYITSKNLPEERLKNKFSVGFAFAKGEYSTAIVEASIREVYGKDADIPKIVKSFSGYGANYAEHNSGNQTETFAEVMAYYAQNGPGKNKFVDSVVKNTKKMLK